MTDKPEQAASAPIIAGIPVTTTTEAQHRMAILLWGASGCGKTTLSATLPGKKLWLNFDPDGLASVGDRPDIVVADFAGQPNSIVKKFADDDPGGVGKFLAANPDVESVIFDSATSFGEKALEYGITDIMGTARGKGVTREDPGRGGYGRKNRWTLLAARNLLRVTAAHNRHLCFICHEDVPQKDKEGHVIAISLMLGSNLAEQTPVHFSEVWAMSDTGKERRIAFRPCRLRRPMKSRMFSYDGSPEFKLANNDSVAAWFDAWKQSGFNKIKPPR